MRLQARQRESGCSSIISFLDSSVSQCVHVKSGSYPVRVRLKPGCVSTRYKGRNMKLITHLIFVPKTTKYRRYTSTGSLLVVDCFANPCLIALEVLEIQSAIRGKTNIGITLLSYWNGEFLLVRSNLMFIVLHILYY